MLNPPKSSKQLLMSTTGNNALKWMTLLRCWLEKTYGYEKGGSATGLVSDPIANWILTSLQGVLIAMSRDASVTLVNHSFGRFYSMILDVPLTSLSDPTNPIRLRKSLLLIPSRNTTRRFLFHRLISFRQRSCSGTFLRHICVTFILYDFTQTCAAYSFNHTYSYIGA